MKLVRATVNDCERIWKLQIEAFADLLAKYQDFEISPGNEPRKHIEAKLLDEYTFFYLIYHEGEIAGAVRVVDRRDGNRKRVAPIFIMKEFRNKGLAQKAFTEIERLHGSNHWMLDTILQEEGNCYLYEKLGYKRTGEIENINERMDIVYYEKN